MSLRYFALCALLIVPMGCSESGGAATTSSTAGGGDSSTASTAGGSDGDPCAGSFAEALSLVSCNGAPSGPQPSRWMRRYRRAKPSVAIVLKVAASSKKVPAVTIPIAAKTAKDAKKIELSSPAIPSSYNV